MNYLEGLNPAQHDAVVAPAAPTVVLAGAGSGKTRVLTHRILHLIKNGAVPHRILAVTFTNKAAKEMRERVESLIKKHASGYSTDGLPTVTTFHALGVRILREFYKEAHLGKYFPIYDRADSMRIVKQAFKELDVDPKQIDPRTILGAISKEKGEGKVASDIIGSETHSYFKRILGEVWYRYEQTLTKERACDFDDLLMKPLKLLRENEFVRKTLQERYDHLLIDEYQDTNTAQAAIAELLVAHHQSIFVVGDIDQNIYSWRGATIANLLSFEETYPDAKLIVLEQNYRSTNTIVQAAQAVIEKNTQRREKTAFTDNPPGDMVDILICSSEGEEAQSIATRCKELLEEDPEASIAILYRTNFQSRALEEAMLREQVPYQVLGTKFFDRKEVKDLISYIRLALHPESQADIARIINTPTRGIGKVTQLAVLSDKMAELGASPRQKVDTFFGLIERIREYIPTHKASESIAYALKESGLEELYTSKSSDDEERLENLRELVSLATKHDHLEGTAGLQELLDEAALLGEQDTMKDAATGVKMMTVHAAKGLEFETVFVTGLEEGLFPHERDDEVDAEEERRLFYVALTRAHSKVFLTLARTRRLYGTLYATVPSSFINDIPPQYVQVEDGDTYATPTIR